MDLIRALDIIKRRGFVIFSVTRLISLSILVFFTGCVGTRYLEANQTILIKEPQINGVSGEIASDLSKLELQKPNKRLGGFLPVSYLVYMHESGKKKFDEEKYQLKIDKKAAKYDLKIEESNREKKKARLTRKKNVKIDELLYKKENGNWRMQTGEPLAVYDSTKNFRSVYAFENYLISNGYFDHSIQQKPQNIGNKRTYNIYNISLGERYLIDSIRLEYPDSMMKKTVINEKAISYLRKGDYYSQAALELRRDHIYNSLTNNGYFTFSRQYINFEVDTFSLKKNRILLTERILLPANGSHLPYKLEAVQFFSNVPKENSERYTATQNGIKFQFEGYKYSPEILESNISIKKDSLYSRENTIQTQRQLSYLDAFKFVNINYDSLKNQRLIANIFTSPLNKYQSSLEVGAVSGSQQIPGPFINVGIKNRNAFKSLDIIDLQGNFSIQGISNVVSEETNYSLIQYGATLGFTLPKFLLIKSDRFKKENNINSTQTRFQVAYNYENRTTEYQRSTAEFSYSYLWRTGERIRHNFSPFTFSYIDVPVIRNDFEQFLVGQDTIGNGALRAAFNSSIISSTSYDFIYNIRSNEQSNERSFLRVFAETGGNLINLLGEDFFLNERQKQLQTSNTGDKFSFFRWAKVNIDYRKVIPINERTDLAYRLNFGVALPYGNEPALPYLKRFYIGGSNSLRAWQVRRLGPGSFGNFDQLGIERDDFNLVNYQTEQGGDMIIEASMEYRRNLVGFVDYALFADLGNIWLINTLSTQSDAQGDDGFFKFDSFWREFAIGAGLGLRLDFSFFVFRLDGAVQIHDPAQRSGNRWVIKNIPFSQVGNLTSDERNILRNKTNITLGIGLPF
jgi:outer membrane protein insertion porin family